MEQDLLTLPKYLNLPAVCIGVLVDQSVVFWVIFCISLFVHLSVFVWSLFCLFFFYLRLRITPLIIFQVFLSYCNNIKTTKYTRIRLSIISLLKHVFVDISRVVDHHCLSFLFMMQNE